MADGVPRRSRFHEICSCACRDRLCSCFHAFLSFLASTLTCYGIVRVQPAGASCLIPLRSLYTIFRIPPAVLALAFASSYASLSILRVLPYLIREILFPCGQAGLDVSSIFADQWHAGSGSCCSKVELDAIPELKLY